MALIVRRGSGPHHGAMISDRRLCLTADKATVVEADDPRSAYLFATRGMEIPAGDVDRFGLSMSDGQVVLAPAVANTGAADGDAPKSDERVATAEWTLATHPQEYLERWPEGPKADLARQVLAERGGDGDA